MPRTLLIRGMFVLLAIAAACGVVAVLLGEGVLGRVAGSAIAAAIALAIAVPLGAWLERDATRFAGQVGLVCVGSVLVLTMLSVWSDFVGIQSERPAGSAFFVALAGVLITGLARAMVLPVLRLASRVAIVLTLAALAFTLVAIWLFTWRSDDTAAGLAALSIGCVPPAFSLLIAPLRRWWPARVIGLLALLVAIVAGVGFVASDPWPGRPGDWILQSPMTIGFCISGAIGYTIAMSRLGERGPRWLVYAASTCAVLTALGIALLELLTRDATMRSMGLDPLVRVTGGLGLLATCGALAIALARVVSGRQSMALPALPGVASIALRCPNCQLEQNAALRGCMCSGCKLIIHVRVLVPRCESCGYGLLNIPGNACPECGTRIALPARYEELPREQPAPAPQTPAGPNPA